MEGRPAPFIERRFELEGSEVVLSFDRPFLAPGGEYRCEWRIEWPGRRREEHACGIDSIQALLLAMRSAHTQLKLSDEFRSGALTYLGERDLDLPPAWE